MQNNNITFCITSYNRWPLLQQTLDSFLSLNTYPVAKIIIIEDSTQQIMKTNILQKYGDKVELIFNDQNIGQIKSIDKMYSQVNTKYILHCEDDYLFADNPNFIQDSIDILEERQDINYIWVRHLHNYIVSHGPLGIKQFEETVSSTKNNVKFRIRPNHQSNYGWCCLSFGPNILRLDDYKKCFPNGYSEFVKNGERSSLAEALCDLHAGEFGYKAAALENGACNNMGASHQLSTYK